MPYIIENLIKYDMTQEEANRLVDAGLLFHDPLEQSPQEYVTTGYVWGDLNLTGEDAFDLFDRFLGRPRVER